MTDPSGEPELQDLQRLHVLTPWLQSWRYLLAVLGGGIAIFRDNLRDLDEVWDFVRDRPLLVVLAVGVLGFLLLAAAVVGWAYLSWRMTGYAIVGSTMYVRRGVLVRQRRQVRLDRLQGVDVQQPLLARLFGLASLKLELAAGAGASTTLGYLGLPDAHRLRGELLSRSGRVRDGGQEPPEWPLLQVPAGRVLAARLLEAVPAVTAVVLYILAVVVLVAGLAGEVGAALAAITPVAPILLAIGSNVTRRFLQEANFRLAESDDGLRIHSGLVSLNHRTVPPRRIQGVHLHIPLIWRFTGWARLTVDVAGSVAGSGGDSWQPAVNTLVPVASTQEVATLFGRVSGIRLNEVAFVPPPPRVRWLDPMAAPWLAVGITDTAAVTRTGWLQRRISVVPFARIQSVRVVQGPLQRMLRLATVHLDGAVGSAGWVAPHRDVADAHVLVQILAARALSARAAES